MNIPVVSPLAARVRAVPAALWFGAALAVCLAALVWHRFCLDPEDRDWLDPGQPPLNLEFDKTATVPAELGRQFRAPRPYPWGSLMQHPGCWIGDC